MGKLITQAEAAKLRGVTVAAINYLVKMKRIRSVAKYGRVLVDQDDVINYKPLKGGRPSKQLSKTKKK
ncbi:MAG TPA: hypothetical protein VGC87_23185 [Pyrinomonadaceae bacterium]|jgi:hypothetical protein